MINQKLMRLVTYRARGEKDGTLGKRQVRWSYDISQSITFYIILTFRTTMLTYIQKYQQRKVREKQNHVQIETKLI